MSASAMYTRSSASPAPNTAATPGWLRDAAARASRRKRRRAAAESSSSSDRTLSATGRRSRVSSAFHTEPIPPWPSLATTLKRSMMRPIIRRLVDAAGHLSQAVRGRLIHPAALLDPHPEIAFGGRLPEGVAVGVAVELEGLVARAGDVGPVDRAFPGGVRLDLNLLGATGKRRG